jgi:hypothetical protein
VPISKQCMNQQRYVALGSDWVPSILTKAELMVAWCRRVVGHREHVATRRHLFPWPLKQRSTIVTLEITHNYLSCLKCQGTNVVRKDPRTTGCLVWPPMTGLACLAELAKAQGDDPPLYRTKEVNKKE